MKISPVNNNRYTNQNTSKENSNVNFKGATATAVKFWQFIDNGGRALQFTAEDMTGTNIPRSVKGALAGYKYSHKINIPALLQEAVREFLTGPTMCITPVAILALATKMGGKSANTHLENIKNLSYLMEGVDPNCADFEKTFTLRVVEDMLKQTIGTETVNKDDVQTLSDSILAYKSITDKKESKRALSQLQTQFESIIKKSKTNFDNTNFLAAKYSISKNETGATNFKNYVGYINSYIQDYTKEYTKENANNPIISKENIQSFKNSWIGKRFVTIAAMIGVTGVLMSAIPKIYTKVSGNVNPNASTIYNEAKKEKKEAK